MIENIWKEAGLNDFARNQPMKITILTALATIILMGCAPSPNIDSEHFRPEYDAAVDALALYNRRPLRSLDEIDFYIASSMEEVQSYCSRPPCNATYEGWGSIVLPPLPADEDPCGWIVNPVTRSQFRYASTVIHEILHAQGLDHDTAQEDQLFSEIQITGWVTFAHRMCPDVYETLQPDIQALSAD